MLRSSKLMAALLSALLCCTGCSVQLGFPAASEPQSSPLTTPIYTPAESTSATDTPATNPPETNPSLPTTTTGAPTTESPSTTPPTTTLPPPITTVPPQTDAPVTPKKQVAITFDDGPDSTRTYKIADKLAEYGAAATFFVVGDRMNKSRGEALAYAIERGSEVGLHSYSHAQDLYYHKCTDEEYLRDMQQTADAIRKYVDTEIRLMRPPGGNITAARVAACPYSVILWNVDSNDWRYKKRTDEATIQTNINTIVDNVMSTVKDGSIILMHEIYENSYEAFCIIIDRLYAEGYEVVTVSELLGEKLQPGTKYSRR